MSQYPSQDPSGPPHQQYRSPASGPTPPEPGIATVALILGIVAMVLSPLLVFGIAALIVGIIAINKTGGPQNIPGRGKAIAGTVLGGSSFVMMVVVALLIAILLPALGAARRTAQRMQNSTQMREYHMGMVQFSNQNKNYYPGLDSSGRIIANGVDTGSSGDGDTVEARYWIMFDKGYVSPDFAISPSEIDLSISPWFSGPGDASHYSYALLSIAGRPGSTPDAGPRGSEWKATAGVAAVLMSDRNTSPSPQLPESIHSDGGPWKGSVLWNDNHTGYEQTYILETQYGNGPLNRSDNLFEASGDSDALLIHRGG